MHKIMLRPAMVMTLFSLVFSGCVQNGQMRKGYAKNDDCLFCHVSNGPAGTIRDVSRFYVNSELHHVTGVRYPLEKTISDDFNLPTGRESGLVFFDKNGNGRPDIDEIRLFVNDEVITMTCASCHREHEKSPVLKEQLDDDFLRGTNANSEMCLTCHRK